MMYQFMFVMLLPFMAIGEKLEPGIVEQTGVVDAMQTDYFGFSRSAFKGTEVEIILHCDSSKDSKIAEYRTRFTIRNTACYNEFTDALSDMKRPEENVLQVYLLSPKSKPPSLKYKEVTYLQSREVLLQCDATHYLQLSAQDSSWIQEAAIPWTVAGSDQKQQSRRKKAVEGTGKNTSTAAPSTIASTTTKSTSNSLPAATIPADGIYLLVVQVTSLTNLTMRVEVRWKAPSGYLSPIDWSLLPFYGVMCGVYAIFGLAWLIVSALQWKDLLRVQFWIGAVIVLGMLEKAVFYAELRTMNSTGTSVEGTMQFAEIISCIKKTLSRMLIIIVSVGFGVVKPRLGSTLHKVVGVGFIYFILCSVEGVMRSSKQQHENINQKKLIMLPLTLLDVAICWWIFSSLVATMRTLRLRRNDVKLSLYRHFMNTLIFAVVASVAFMIWSLVMHNFTVCLSDWPELWIDQAVWHLLFCVILLVIMILWRPTNNNQRYAFTPLLDDVDDDEDTVFSADTSSLGVDTMKMRGRQQVVPKQDREESLEDELKWVEQHIPSSITDKALPVLVDSEEEEQHTRFEISKMQ